MSLAGKTWRSATGFANPAARKGVVGALLSAVVGQWNELRSDAPLTPTPVNVKGFPPPALQSLPLWLVVLCVLRLPSRSSGICRSSLAPSKACMVPKRSRASSSTDRFSSSAVSYTWRRRIMRQLDPGPPGVMDFGGGEALASALLPCWMSRSFTFGCNERGR